MKKLYLLTWVISIFCLNTFANPIEVETAKKVGETFLIRKTKVGGNNALALNLVYTEQSSATATANVVYFYVFNYGENGFVIVSGDDNTLPVLAYSDESNFDPNNIPQNTKKWLEEYKNQIRYIIHNQIGATTEIQKEWDELISGKAQNVFIPKSVSPLIQTKWDQSPYYNALCPSGTVTGCVATAMAQVMKYWNYPAKGTGFHSYNHPNYGTLSSNFGSTTYQWSSMPNVVSSSNNAVATLMYQVGVSVDMNYGPASTGGSGAFVISAQTPVQHCSEYALKTYFGYKSSLKGVERANYNQTQWLSLLKTELNAGRPIIYAGFGTGGGHCFVADGYDNNDYIHFNWGWGGYYDGYFQINALNPGGVGTGGGSGGFNTGHQAVIGIEPANTSSTQNYDLQLYSNISMPSTQIWFTNPFSLTVDIANYGTGSFSGQYGAAIFDQDYNFVDWLEVKSNMTLNASSHYSTPLTFSNAGSAAFVPGQYYTAIYYKTATQGWTIIDDGSYSNLKSFKIIYSADIETNSNFTITNNGGKLIQGKSATVNVDILNTGSSTFYGQYRISLSNLDGTFAQSIQILNENNGLPNGYHYTGGNNFTGNITVSPGTYLMEVAYKAQGSSSWYYSGSTDYSNPVYVIVEAPDLQPDIYEVNNTKAQAYNLPVTFSGNNATKTTTGSNIHIGTDNDYYKITLPTGYNYSISARLHDSYSSTNGNTYTVDALVSYSTDGGNTWSEAYDDVILGTISINNGGTVYFRVAPYFSGDKGTYVLTMNLNRTEISTTGINNTDISKEIKVYPNPANNYVIVDFNELSEVIDNLSIITIQGQVIKTITVNNNQKEINIALDDFSQGVYLINLYGKNGIITKKLIVNK